MSAHASPPDSNLPCPCARTDAKGRVQSLAACCGRYVGAKALETAPDAEHLMRSRYTAFVLEDADYLLRTWHPSQRPASLDFDPDAKWLGLQIKHHDAMGDDTAEVEFVARYRLSGRAVRLHERSRFVREYGQWLYVDGDQR